ncbi:hypothetical protein ACSNOJ_08205 [Streptomyces sp. URMC 128]|uniref:hypothetical protein n=1 Tax=Streptomyces sp. URMC 128 TaxID=3423404 RepID=UPI003F1D3511
MSGGMKAGGVALRLVLLTLLLGVGVLHTLSHAGAHGGVSASDAVAHSPQVHAALADDVGFPQNPDASAAALEHDDAQHRAHTEGTPASDCLALIPSGLWLLPPSCTSTWAGMADLAGGVDVAQDPDGGPARARLSVLRI